SKIDITHEASIITSIALLYNYIFHSVNRKKKSPAHGLADRGNIKLFFHVGLGTARGAQARG
ncbi:MAG: hypothetical protein IKN34_12985, partial [Treponema sp.]|nr:hypothetical protein [Treponema sp.]